MELLRVKTLIHVDKWAPWLSKLLKTKLVRYVDGVKEKTEKWVSLNEDVDLNLVKTDKQKRVIEFY